MTTTTLETLTRAAERALELAPKVRSVVLFGSRARGTARQDSDWDVALITERDNHAANRARRAFAGLDNVETLTVTMTRLDEECDQAAALAPALVSQGIALAGRWDPTPWRNKELRMNPDTLYQEVKTIAEKIMNCLTSQASTLFLHHNVGTEPESRSAIRDSARGAELTAKLIINCHGETAENVHDVQALAEQLARCKRPLTTRDEKARFTRAIQGVNGNTQAANQADYGKPCEGMEDTMRRTERTMPLLDEWLKCYLSKRPQSRETIRKLKSTVHFYASKIERDEYFPLLPESAREAVTRWKECRFTDFASTHTRPAHPLTDVAARAARDLEDPDARLEARAGSDVAQRTRTRRTTPKGKQRP